MMQRLGLRWSAVILPLCLTVSGEAKANDEGCTVILCLSNPAGWAAVAECIPPVQRALKAMAKGRLPQCAFSGGVGAHPRIIWISEPAAASSSDVDAVQVFRALEYRDGAGVVRRIKF